MKSAASIAHMSTSQPAMNRKEPAPDAFAGTGGAGGNGWGGG